MLASIAQIVTATQAEGPGRRMAVWFQGCPLRCAGCCNPEMLPFSVGQAIDVDELVKQLLASKHARKIEGVTLLGGEPFAHAAPAALVARAAQANGLSVMIFSGYLLEDLRSRADEATQSLLAAADILVDGPYVRESPDTARRWIGSTNQRIHFLTERYRADDPCWQASNTLEIRWQNGELSVNGFPAANAKPLWKRPLVTEARS
jgi:anaerobic ribonucleoside-triphosphate reductase activating protein